MEINWDPTTLLRVVNGVRYIMPGWQIWLSTDNETGNIPALHIISYTPNSYHPEEMIGVNHSFLVPLASYNERTWKAWVFECYMKVWRHELGEMLLFDGVREFAPHHGNGEDPYITWHIGDKVDTEVRAGFERIDDVELLKKYIAHVGLYEGSTFLADHKREAYEGMPKFTDAEWARLQELQLEEIKET